MFGYFDGLLRYFEFSGRSTRTQYWVFHLVLLVLVVAAVFADLSSSTSSGGEARLGFFSVFVVIVHIIPGTTLIVRRLHDSGRSGWWYWISLVPLIGSIWLLVLMCLGPSDDADRYGDDPRWGSPEPQRQAKQPKLTRAQAFVAEMEERRKGRSAFTP